MATYTWTGFVNTNWEDSGNWDQGTGYPQAGDEAVFSYTSVNVYSSGQVYSNVTVIGCTVQLNNTKLTVQSGNTITVSLQAGSTLQIFPISSTEASLYANTGAGGGSFSLVGDYGAGNSLYISGWDSPGSVSIDAGIVVYLNGDNTIGTASVGVSNGATLNINPSSSNFPQQNWSVQGGTVTCSNSYAAFASGTSIQLGGGGTINDGGYTTWDSTYTLNWNTGAGSFTGSSPAGYGVNQQVVGNVALSEIAAYLTFTDTLTLAGGSLDIKPTGGTIGYNLDAISGSLLF